MTDRSLVFLQTYVKLAGFTASTHYYMFNLKNIFKTEYTLFSIKTEFHMANLIIRRMIWFNIVDLQSEE